LYLICASLSETNSTIANEYICQLSTALLTAYTDGSQRSPVIGLENVSVSVYQNSKVRIFASPVGYSWVHIIVAANLYSLQLYFAYPKYARPTNICALPKKSKLRKQCGAQHAIATNCVSMNVGERLRQRNPFVCLSGWQPGFPTSFQLVSN